MAFPRPECEFGRQGDEECKTADLEAETRYHDVSTHVVFRDGVGTTCNGPTGGLEEKRKEVAANKEYGVSPRSDAGDVLAVDDHDAGEAKVN